MKILLGLLAYNNFEKTTKLCLDSLLPQIDNDYIKLKVLDNNSSDGSCSKLVDYYKSNKKKFSYELSDENLGFPAGFNKIFNNQSEDWFIIVDSDTFFPNNSIKTLYKILENSKNNQKIIVPLTNSAGNCQHIQFKNKDIDSVLKSYQEIVVNGSDYLQEIYRGDFFCAAIKSELWKELKGFDEIYGLGYYEDFDFCVRAKKIGFPTFLAEKWFVFHKGSESFKHEKKQNNLLKTNKKIFLAKHPLIKLLHRRNDILQLLLKQTDNKKNPLFISRVNYLYSDLPKSPLKKFLWLIKLNLKKINK
jgi:GT2 family glycosyltransferase